MASITTAYACVKQEFDMRSLAFRFLWLLLVLNKLKFYCRANSCLFPSQGKQMKEKKAFFSLILNKTLILHTLLQLC